MKKKTLICLFALIYFFLPLNAFSQVDTATLKNIYSIMKNDPKNSLWHLKKTETLRINLVKMQGEGKRHSHPDAEHTILLIRGKIKADIDGKKITLRKGDMLSIPTGLPHKYIIKRKKAIIVSMDAPYYNPDKTIMLE